MIRTLKIAQLLYGYLVALNKINTFVIYHQVGLIQGLKDQQALLVCWFVGLLDSQECNEHMIKEWWLCGTAVQKRREKVRKFHR
ncbi:hypothetical protein BCU75_17540 [Vibrio splendidus]|nr:hypothetical protein BCU75_17540 [Vibrio splendidus]